MHIFFKHNNGDITNTVPATEDKNSSTLKTFSQTHSRTVVPVL